MPLALLQTELEPLDAGQLAAAFSTVPEITTEDAIRMAQYNIYGIMATHLTPEVAARTQAALADQGLASEVVDLTPFTLPPSLTLKILELKPEAFVIFNSYNQPRPISWQNLFLIAAGHVNTTETSSTYEIYSRTPLHSNDGLRYGSPELALGEHRYKEKHVDHLVIEVLTENPTERFRIDAKTFRFTKGGNMTEQARNEQLTILLGKLREKAVHATLNRGAQSLLDENIPDFTYPGKLQFEQEMIWHWWKKTAEHQSRDTPP